MDACPPDCHFHLKAQDTLSIFSQLVKKAETLLVRLSAQVELSFIAVHGS